MQQTIETERALVVQTAPRGSWLGQPVVVDDSPLWLAWETAQAAWLMRVRLGRKGTGSGENTARAYGAACREFFAFIRIPPWEIGTADAQEWANWLRSPDRTITDAEGKVKVVGPLSDATVNLKLAALASFYYFVQTNYSKRTPAGREVTLWPANQIIPFNSRAVVRADVPMYGRATFPTTDELTAILAEINTETVGGKRDFAFLYAVATTCRRCSEVTHLKWGDLQQLKSGDMAFEYRYKGNKIRKAVLNRKAYQAICAYVIADGRPPEKMTADDYVFVPLDPEKILRLRPQAVVEPNRPISNHTANGILKRYARRVGVEQKKAHIHGLRHAGAHLRIEQQRSRNAIDYEEIMTLLGHANLATTQIYIGTVHTEPEDPGGDAAAEALLPKGKKRRQRKPAGEQGKLL